MDLDEAIKLLRGGEDGVDEWNRRRGEGEKVPDLGGANLKYSTFFGAKLSDANLRDADLFTGQVRALETVVQRYGQDVNKPATPDSSAPNQRGNGNLPVAASSC